MLITGFIYKLSKNQGTLFVSAGVFITINKNSAYDFLTFTGTYIELSEKAQRHAEFR